MLYYTVAFSGKCKSEIVERNNFLKIGCSDDNDYEYLKCVKSDDIYRIKKTGHYSFFHTEFDKACPNDPNHYQVCGSGLNELITNKEGLLCGYYTCEYYIPLYQRWGNATSKMLSLLGRECDGTQHCTNNLDELHCGTN